MTAVTLAPLRLTWEAPSRSGVPTVEMVFVPIPAGSFVMGSRREDHDEEPIHRVVIARHFWMAETPVTQAQLALWTASASYDRWRAARGQADRHENGFPGGPNHPSENVTWHEAIGYCEWLSTQQGAGLPPDRTAGLPSEAQWEYACRAGTNSEYWSGDGESALADVGWYDGNSAVSTQPVGRKPANRFGLHDMHGNVWEWCRDAWDPRAYRRPERFDGVTDPEVTAEQVGDENPGRVVRGGSWGNWARGCRSAIRFGWWPGNRGWFRGFRVCLFPGPAVRPGQGSG